uniref:Uncharacterized protein n=1 Tax=Steinernema glaseri TaxID=37863 RepID=A0A1I7ZB19_9BILA
MQSPPTNRIRVRESVKEKKRTGDQESKRAQSGGGAKLVMDVPIRLTANLLPSKDVFLRIFITITLSYEVVIRLVADVSTRGTDFLYLSTGPTAEALKPPRTLQRFSVGPPA